MRKIVRIDGKEVLNPGGFRSYRENRELRYRGAYIDLHTSEGFEKLRKNLLRVGRVLYGSFFRPSNADSILYEFFPEKYHKKETRFCDLPPKYWAAGFSQRYQRIPNAQKEKVLLSGHLKEDIETWGKMSASERRFHEKWNVSPFLTGRVELTANRE